ncbi:MAG TPA: dihydrolipoyllysine-residue acetyltransferase [Steroidobacteraceae bacterium]|jgi:pyruvate dehydrogenase E2 component (dihydrolipoamide acetyltransferase)|nr:dihydrolipoyllysine-residue acetyltransferase [Steroidobacteraceae bacterium]
MAQEIHVPDIGDFKNVEVIDVLVKVGDKVEIDTPLVTIETEKATMDVPSSAAGVIKSMAIKKGDRVSKGSLVLTLEGGAATAPAAEAPKPAVAVEVAPAPAVSEQIISVPDIGDFKGVEVIDVLIKVGDKIEVDAPLITIETEKATMDVPSTAAGVVKSIAVKKGDRVSKGSAVATISGSGGAATSTATQVATAPKTEMPVTASAPATVATQAAVPVATTSLPAINEAGFAKAHASPSVRRFARELGVDLSRVKGNGVKGRITPDDVKSFVKQVMSGAASASGGGALPKIAEVDFSKFGPVEVKPLGRIQKISGPRLHASWLNLPHVWQMDEADITDLEAKRNALKAEALARNIKLTPLAFIIRAVVRTLKEYPTFNSSLDGSGQNLVMKKYMNIGFAADTPNGLTVPVIRNADQKDIYEIAQDLAALSEKARDGKLSGADMQGACFTISSLGGIGGTSFTPIINAPEVAILGVSKSSMKPVWNATTNAFEPRLILPFTLAYDHRVIDGALGARFVTYLSKQLANVKGLLEAVP